MSSHWQHVERVFQDALDLPEDSRQTFLDEACSGDAELRREASSLLEAHGRAGDFIDEPAILTDAPVLAAVLPDRNIGRTIGVYEIVERIGSGGMGDVYLANDSRLGRQVALKILSTVLVADPNHLRRFETEARAVSKLNHPNVLTIHEVGNAEGVSYIATEFIDGETLRKSIGDQNTSLAEVLEISIQVGSALQAAHSSGIVHRDIKPENIMLRRDGLVKVLDFGIAKPTGPVFANDSLTTSGLQTEVGVVLGTVAYMSPEQARGLAVDERSDLWSLGVVLYELLAGVQPFTGATRMDTLAAILERQPRLPLTINSDSPDYLRDIQRILNRSLEKDREHRYQTAEEFLGDLKQVKQSLTWTSATDAKRPSFTSQDEASLPKQEPTRVSRWVVPVVMFSVMALVAFAFLYRQNRTRQAENSGTAIPESKPYAQMTEAEKLVFVRLQEQRISAMMGDRPAVLNEEALLTIKHHIDDYDSRRASNPNRPPGDSLQEIYSRAIPHLPLISRSFTAEKVPVTIGIYLPIIESAYRQCFVSALGAKGMFQFMPQTARIYGVAENQMCDDDKMTPAAARYIADMMAELGEDAQSMTLVLLSYNQGGGAVRDTLRELRGAENFRRDFWTLFAHRNELDSSFRNEGARYVPSFFAAAIIGENPQAFELEMPPLSTLADKK